MTVDVNECKQNSEDALPLTVTEGVGVALGFDRLMMLASGADSIDAVRYFNSDNS